MLLEFSMHPFYVASKWCAVVETGLFMNYIQESGFFLLEDLEVVDLPDWVDIGYECIDQCSLLCVASDPSSYILLVARK